LPSQLVTPNLEQLAVSSGSKELIEIPELRNSPNLQILRLGGCVNISDFKVLQGLVKLEVLDLEQTKFDDCKLLDKMEKLKFLNLARSKVKSLAALPNCQALLEVNISRTQVTSIRPLLHLPKLREVSMSHLKIARYANVYKLRKSVKILNESTGENHDFSRIKAKTNYEQTSFFRNY
jgi:internalin A